MLLEFLPLQTFSLLYTTLEVVGEVVPQIPTQLSVDGCLIIFCTETQQLANSPILEYDLDPVFLYVS